MTDAGGAAAPVAPSEIVTREELAAALTALRTRAGLSVRALAQALNTPTATVGDYCSGRHLPGPAQQELFCAMLRLFGVADGELDTWLEVVARLRSGSDGRMRRVAAPYQGLAPFDVQDHERFFGREATTEEVLARLQAQLAGSPRGLVLVVGPSGAGKSSLLRAGAQARIDAGALDGDRTWSTCLCSPGEQPLENLQVRLAELPAHNVVVIIDQLEELLAATASAQDSFLDEIEHLIQSGMLVLAGLRADFYEQAVRVPALLAALRAGPVLLAPMTADELRSAIIGPASYAGAQVDDGLVELLIADLAPRDVSGFAHDAGSLPLLSHALLQSWQRARGNHLTTADYRAAGGLQGAVRQTAEELYGQLSAEQQQLARRVFMRLVRVPEDGPAVRRRARRHELEALDGAAENEPATDTSQADEVVSRFVDARLLTVDVATVELSHEALVTAWPRLGAWIEENRDGLRLHRQLTDAANDWVAAGRDPALLLRGPRQQLIDEWAREPDNRGELNADEREFLSESQELSLRERRATVRRVRQMRALMTVSLLSAVAAFALAAVALHASDTAKRARDDALSRQIALQAGSLTASAPSLAMQLAVLAHRISPTTDATSALLNASDGELPTRVLGPTGPAFLSVAPDTGRLAIAYSAVDRISVYELTGDVPRLSATVSAGPASAQVFAVALSPNGRLLAAGGTDHKVTVWRLSPPAQPTKIATLALPAGTVYGLTFSPDGGLLAAVNAASNVHLWSVRGNGPPQPQPTLTAPDNTALHALQFSSGGRELASAGTNGEVLVWRTTTPGKPALTMHVAGAPTLNAISFSPSGQELAVGGNDNLIHRWTLTSGAAAPLAPLRGFTSWIEALAFSPNGKQLAAGSSDDSLRIWSATGSAPPTVITHPAPVTGIAFASRGAKLLSADAAGTLRAWTLPPPSMWIASGKVFGLDYTANGRELAVISSGPAGSAQLWDTANPTDPALVATIPTGSFGAVAGAGAMTADGKLLAIANAHAQVRLLDISDPHRAHPVGPLLTGATPYIEQMAFAPSGRLLAAGDDAGHVELWDTSDPSHPVSERTLNRGEPPQIMLGVAFSPNGRLLASASTNGHVTLWDIAQPKHPRLISTVAHLSGYAYSVAFTPNGRTLIAAGADQTARLWNISNPAHPAAIGKPLTGPTSTIYDIAISPDGTKLAAATTDGSVWLWNIANLASPRRLAGLTASSSDLYAVSFQPHSNTLIAGGTDQQLHTWDDNPSDLTRRICRIAGTPLTPSEWGQYVQSGHYEPPCR